MESQINVSLRVKPLSASEEKGAKHTQWQLGNGKTITNRKSKETF